MSSTKEDNWDLVIDSKSKFFNFNFYQIWEYKDLLLLLVKRDFISFYKQTVLGPLWFIVQPLFTMGIYIFIFGNLAGVSTDGAPRPLFYLVGIICWSYFSDCLTKTSTVFRDNIGIFGKVYFPRLVIPLSIVISNMLRFFIQLILLSMAMLYYYIVEGYSGINGYIFFFPYMLFLLAIQGLGLGLVITALTTKYRDLVLLLNFGIQLLMYSTTVTYPLSSLSGNIKLLISLNPLTAILESTRYGLLGVGAFDISLIAYSTFFSFICLTFGVLIFNKVEKNFVDTI